jgi:hypothetical protein
MSALRIEQVSGPRRAMIFNARSMPFRPLTLTRRQRVATTWLPGNPKAVQQVIGPVFEPTTLTGSWKDKFLASNESAVRLINFPALSPAVNGQASVASSSTFVGTNAFPGTQLARLARVVSDAVELMVAEGQDIRWQWDQFVRYGKFTRYQVEWGNPTGGISDCRWELECEWSGDIEAPPIVVTTSVNLLTTAAGLAQLLQELQRALDEVAALRLPNAWVNAIVGPLRSIAATLARLISTMRSIVTITRLPGDVAANVAALLQQLRLESMALVRELSFPRSAAGESAKLGRADAVQIANAVYQLLRKRLVELAAFAAEQQRVLALFEADEIIATFFADAQTSLRDVSTRYYGRPDEWVRISVFNAFYSSTVAAGTLVRVPKLG